MSVQGWYVNWLIIVIDSVSTLASCNGLAGSSALLKTQWTR